MEQRWKALGIVTLGAALVGWLVVRTMTAGPLDPAHRMAAPASAPATDEPGPTVAPAQRLAPATSAPEKGDATTDVIVRDLNLLLRVLLRDQHPEDRVLPRINDALDMPGGATYRRSPDFWEPAFASRKRTTP